MFLEYISAEWVNLTEYLRSESRPSGGQGEATDPGEEVDMS